jgi:hypothetical protein
VDAPIKPTLGRLREPFKVAIVTFGFGKIYKKYNPFDNINLALKEVSIVGPAGFEPATKRIQAQFQLGYKFTSD